MATGQHQGQGVIAETGLLPLHLLLQVVKPVLLPGEKADFKQVKVVFTGHFPARLTPVFRPQGFDLLKIVLQFSRRPEIGCGFLHLGQVGVGRGAVQVRLLPHEAGHPPGGQGFAGGNAGLRRNAGAKDKAKPLAIGNAPLHCPHQLPGG